jgi:MoxR-like ATPase
MEEMENNQPQEQSASINTLHQDYQRIQEAIGEIVIGNENVLQYLMIAMLSKGHVLLEGMPGIAKTLTAKLLAQCVDTDFKRIQFTPDLMPSDILGTNIYNMKNQEFEFNKGPIFSNLILIDEINRAPAKTQAALFEVMEELQVTVDGHTFSMSPPFMILATQNPVEQEGTYRLPEAQLDRFMFKINMGYPSVENELKMLNNKHNNKSTKEEITTPILSPEKISAFQEEIKKVSIKDTLLKYIIDIVQKTRLHPAIFLGASPRASVAILESAKVNAAIEGRDFVTPEDIRFVLPPVLNHRIQLTPEKEMEGLTPEDVILEITKSIAVPR